jgi:hypothetical protein
MRIQVLAPTVNYQSILEHYNSNKPEDEEPLERLDRTEGGFQIQIPSMKDKSVDENRKIRQLRWANGWLVSGFYIGFTEKQTMLLYEALVYSLGGNVLLES